MSDQPVALYRLGDQGSAVRSIRALLQASGDLAPSALEASDVYDEEVADAIRAFQQRRGLMVDGVLGPQTHIALAGAHWKLGDRMLSHIPGHMLQGDDVGEHSVTQCSPTFLATCFRAMMWPNSRSVSSRSGSPPTGSTGYSEPTPSMRFDDSRAGWGWLSMAAWVPRPCVPSQI